MKPLLILFTAVISLAVLNTLYAMDQRADIQTIILTVILVILITFITFAFVIGKQDIVTNFNRLFF